MSELHVGKPKLAIFDLGNVVFRIDWQPMFEIWSAASGVAAADLRQRFKFDRNFELFERAALPADEFHQRICVLLGAWFSYEDFVRGWNAIYQDVIGDIDRTLAELKDKVRVVAFTNTNEVHSTIWPKRYQEVLAHFEHVFARPRWECANRMRMASRIFSRATSSNLPRQCSSTIFYRMLKPHGR